MYLSVHAVFISIIIIIIIILLLLLLSRSIKLWNAVRILSSIGRIT